MASPATIAFPFRSKNRRIEALLESYMRALLYNRQSSKVVSGGEELISDWKNEDSTTIWLHIDGAITKEIQKLLIEEFDLHRLGLQDACRDRHPPKLEEFSNCSFIILKTLTDGTSDIEFSTLQTILFVGERFLVTRTSESCKTLNTLFLQEHDSPRRIKKSPGSIACRLIRLSIDRYLKVLLELETTLDSLEKGLSENMNDVTLAEVTGYKGNLKRLRRIFLYHEQLLHKLHADGAHGFPEELVHELNDLHEQQERASSLTLLYYELSSDLIEGYLSLSSHRLNQIMKVLTVVTVIFVPLGFLAGIYGMNFENMPELHSRAGYYVLLSIMAAIATTLLTIFRKKKWL